MKKIFMMEEVTFAFICFADLQKRPYKYSTFVRLQCSYSIFGVFLKNPTALQNKSGDYNELYFVNKIDLFRFSFGSNAACFKNLQCFITQFCVMIRSFLFL